MEGNDQLCGYIERITFQSVENGFTVAQLKSPHNADLICIVGTMPSLQPGETIRCYGSWKQHLIYGKQFVVSEHKVEAPSDILGIKKYLGSGLIKGIGTKYANRIVEKFGVDTLNVIDQNPMLLNQVSGLGPKRVEKIINCWGDQRAIRAVMIFLQSHGVSPTYAQKIFKTYKEKSISTVTENPFRLAQDIHGIGFKTADKIAEKLGIPKDAPQRLDAGLEHLLSELSNEGHTCYPEKELLELTSRLLETEEKLLEERLLFLLQEERIERLDLVHEHQLTPFIWLKALFMSETGIAREISRLQKHPSLLRAVQVEKALEWVQKRLNIKLAENQKEAVAKGLQEKLQIITGGPGTGKSTITNALLTISEQLNAEIILAAPTGRAAKRMSEITGKKASTIHSLLEFDFKGGGFRRNRKNPLLCDLIIVDEASMIDTFLMFSLLKALPDCTRVIFVGDIHQLPSVGAGNVLKDLIFSQQIPVTTLNEIFRQAAGSRIITNAHRINQGIYPDIRNLSQSDFYFVEAEEPQNLLPALTTLVSERIPQKFGFHVLNEIQVLVPMKKGLIGAENLNLCLQKALNPNSPTVNAYGKQFAVGDKVMQLRNNYQKEVFNGDIGRITAIDLEEQQLMVAIEEREVLYEFNELDSLSLAYAVSTHKYQGSECPCVVIVFHTSHFKLLHRNLLYTAVTRGKKMVILIGNKKAIGIAVKNDEVKKRYTGLRAALIHSKAGL